MPPSAAKCSTRVWANVSTCSLGTMVTSTPPRVLEAGGKEVNAVGRTVEIADEDLAKVMLRELAGQAVEPHHWPRRDHAEGADQFIEGGLGAVVASQLGPSKRLLLKHEPATPPGSCLMWLALFHPLQQLRILRRLRTKDRVE